MKIEVACLLGAARWAPLALIAVPIWPARLALVAIATLAIAPALVDVAQPPSTVAAIVHELMIGLLCAMVFAAPFFAARSAELMVRPLFGDAFLFFALALFCSIDGPVLTVRAMAQSYAAFPVGTMFSQELALTTVINSGATLIVAAVTLAAPVLAVLWLTEIVSGAIVRAQPALEGAIGAAPRTVIATLALAALTTKMGAYLVHDHFTHLGEWLKVR